MMHTAECVCVCERERERESETVRESQRQCEIARRSVKEDGKSMSDEAIYRVKGVMATVGTSHLSCVRF